MPLEPDRRYDGVVIDAGLTQAETGTPALWFRIKTDDGTIDNNIWITPNTIKRAAATNAFKGKSGATLDILAPEGLKAQRLIVVGTEDALRTGVQRPVARASGLRRRLWGQPPSGSSGSRTVSDQ